MSKRQTIPLCASVAILLMAWSARGAANEIPLQLPKPDGKAGDTTKPVKVYILAGQSNMVGMGDLSGARPPFPNQFLTADPAVIPGAMPIGMNSGGKPISWLPVARHGVFDAKASIHHGPDDAAKQPITTAPVALGTVAANLPAVADGQTLVVTAQIDVPVSGTYTVHAGFGDSSHNVVHLDGKEVYRRETGAARVITKVPLEAGKRYPIKITYSKSGSAAFWLEQVDIEGKGDLKYLTGREGKFTYLLDDAGNWSARQDVTYTDPRLFPTRAASPLSATSNNGKSIGPELGFGSVMGEFHGEQVLLIKTAMGNRSLRFDFRPPSSGRTDPENKYEAFEYNAMIEGVRDTLAKIDKVVPGYAGQGYEIAGFGWFQGHKDSGSTKEEYEKCLVDMINDVRKEFKSPKMPAVVATVGFGGYKITEGGWKGVWEAQMAVGDPEQHPDFAGNVASVDIRDFWRERIESPADQDHHYHRNPETYLLVGEAMGRAMVRLHGGKATEIPKSDREKQYATRVAAAAAEAAKPEPTTEEMAASVAALRPILLDGALAAYLGNPRYQPALLAAIKGERPAKMPSLLGDALDEVGDFHRAAVISDYDWKPFVPEVKDAAWDYHAFDLPAGYDKSKGIADLKAIHPAGMENWFEPGFDAKNAGWRSGVAPFGVEKDTMVYPEWYGSSKRGPVKTVADKDVLLLRQTFGVPPLKEGYRYRIRVAGSPHLNHGEGYAIYINGKLLAESKAGITAWRREGGRPRGSHVWADFRDEFKNGKVTIAIASFPMNNNKGDGFLPAGQPLSVWLEEMKVPPVE
jgi:alpha-galactosidase